MNLIHIIDCYYWIWIQSAIDNERCLWLWGSNANVADFCSSFKLLTPKCISYRRPIQRQGYHKASAILTQSLTYTHKQWDRQKISYYAYLACKIQNFLRQGGAAPFQHPPGGQPPVPPAILKWYNIFNFSFCFRIVIFYSPCIYMVQILLQNLAAGKWFSTVGSLWTPCSIL